MAFKKKIKKLTDYSNNHPLKVDNFSAKLVLSVVQQPHLQRPWCRPKVDPPMLYTRVVKMEGGHIKLPSLHAHQPKHVDPMETIHGSYKIVDKTGIPH